MSPRNILCPISIKKYKTIHFAHLLTSLFIVIFLLHYEENKINTEYYIIDTDSRPSKNHKRARTGSGKEKEGEGLKRSPSSQFVASSCFRTT